MEITKEPCSSKTKPICIYISISFTDESYNGEEGFMNQQHHVGVPQNVGIASMPTISKGIVEAPIILGQAKPITIRGLALQSSLHSFCGDTICNAHY